MDEVKEKKPYRNYIWFLLIVVVVFAFVLIRTLFEAETNVFSSREKSGIIIGSLIGGLIVFTIIYHLGKAIFALISGFEIMAINILFLTFSKQNKKWKLSLTFPEGFGGMVHVIAKKEYDKCNPILFHFGGLITCILIPFIISLILYFVDNTNKLLYISLIASLAGLIVLIMNLLPVYLDDVNDGFAIRLLLEKNNRKAYFDNLLQYSALYFQNGELKYFEYENYDDIFQVNSLVYQYYYFMDKNDYINAQKSCLKLLENKKFAFHEDVVLMEVNKLYFYLLKESNEKCYDYFYSLDKEYRNFALSGANYETLKTGILLAVKVEKTYDVFEHLLKNEQKTKESYYPCRIEKEDELIKKAKEIAYKEFPDWEN